MRRSPEPALRRPESSARTLPSRRLLRHLAGWTLGVGAGLLPRAGVAWQHFHTSQGAPMHWSAEARRATLRYTIDQTGLEADGLAIDGVVDAVKQAFDRWQQLDCHASEAPSSGPQTDAASPTSPRATVRFHDAGLRAPGPVGLGCAEEAGGRCIRPEPDGNQVLFVRDAASWTFGSRVVATTVVSAEVASGEIAEADIALNDVSFHFCLDACGPHDYHLGAVVQHEVGHFLGLDHSSHISALMAADRPVGVVSLLPMDPDDIAGLCALYPGEAVPLSPSAEPVSVGCSTSTARGQIPPRGRGGWFVCAMAVSGGALLRRHRRRASREPEP